MSSDIPTGMARWVAASFYNHFHVILKTGKGYVLHFEGAERPTDGQENWIEVRVDGPMFHENTDGQYSIRVEVNLLCVAMVGEDAYKLDTMLGDVTNAFKGCIEIKKYGGEVGDDQSLVGVMTLLPRNRDRVEIAKFGKIRPDTRQLQAVVEGHYRGYFSV